MLLGIVKSPFKIKYANLYRKRASVEVADFSLTDDAVLNHTERRPCSPSSCRCCSTWRRLCVYRRLPGRPGFDGRQGRNPPNGQAQWQGKKSSHFSRWKQICRHARRKSAPLPPEGLRRHAANAHERSVAQWSGSHIAVRFFSLSIMGRNLLPTLFFFFSTSFRPSTHNVGSLVLRRGSASSDHCVGSTAPLQAISAGLVFFLSWFNGDT